MSLISVLMLMLLSPLLLDFTDAADYPHIVIILADDLGWNDISLHGSNQFMTPNIDALACSGVTMKNYYTQSICTPARSALLTGRHPINNGMENDVIYAPEPRGLPLSERLLPQYLQTLGYKTRAVGKWHLGFFKANYTPTRRGFDSHYGGWLGHQDHYTHFGYEPQPGFDFHRELNVSWEALGRYTADLYTEEAETIINSHNVSQPLFLYIAHNAPHAPLQAPKELIDKFQYIPDKKRQVFAGMVTKVDESVGRVTKALEEKDMLNNSIILFLTDNGGATNGFNGNVASNWPLRGCKDTLFEGGVRGVGLIWSPLLKGAPRVHHGLVNVQDWLPTLLEAIGATTLYGDMSKLDGVSQWAALNKLSSPPYSTMLHNIDPVRNIGALRHGEWKIVTGRTYNGQYDGFYGKLTGEVPYVLDKIRNSPAGLAVQTTSRPLPEDDTILMLRNETIVSCFKYTSVPHVIQVRATGGSQVAEENPTECRPHIAPCLFNLVRDPCETENVATAYPEIVKELLNVLQSYKLAPPNNKPEDPRSYPVHWNNTWTTWQDFVAEI